MDDELGDDPIGLAAKYTASISEGHWENVDPDVLRSLQKRLSADAKLNLDAPLELEGPDGLQRFADSGDVAKAALESLTAAMTGGAPAKDHRGRRGRKRGAELLKKRLQHQMERMVFRKYCHVADVPASSYPEYLAWEAEQLLLAKSEAVKRDVSSFDVFKERMLPRLEYWKTADGDYRPQVARERHTSALATIGAAGAPTRRAIRRALGLTSRSKGKNRRFAGDGETYDVLVSKGIRILEGKTVQSNQPI